MEYAVLVLALIESHILAVIAGGFLHYKYGRQVEMKLAKEVAAVAEKVTEAVTKAAS